MTSSFQGLRAALYARVSTQRQAGEDRWSLATQRARFEGWCRANGAVASGVFSDTMSGRRDDRREYQRLLAVVRARAVDVVVVQWLDRFGRNHKEILPRLWEIEGIGGRVVATDEDLSHELIRMIRAWQSSDESRKIGERVRATQEQAAKDGRRIGRAPYGYRLITDRASPERGRVVVHEDEAAVVRRIFGLCAERGLGKNGIAGLLNREGVAAPKGGAWGPTTVWRILRNEGYVRGPRSLGFDQGAPVVVDEATWARARATLDARAEFAPRTGNVPYLLRGLVRCACGAVRHCWTVAPRSAPSGRSWKQIRYYQCKRQVLHQGCAVGVVNAERLERSVLERFAAATLDEAVIEAAIARARAGSDGARADRERRIATLRGQRTQLRARLSHAADLAADRTWDRATYRQKTAEYRAELAAVEAELGKLTDPDATIGQLEERAARLRSLFDVLPVAGPPEQHTILRTLVERVEIDRARDWELVLREEWRAWIVFT